MDLSTAFDPHYYSENDKHKPKRKATKKSFANGKVRKVLAGNALDAREIEAGAVTYCLNTVAQFVNGAMVDSFVWDGEQYVSRQSLRTLYTS